jgi:hypothetical protein
MGRRSHASARGGSASRWSSGELSSVPPRIFLDANVWRRLSDAQAIEPLRMRAKADEGHILIAPAVVYEMLRTPDPALRARLVRAVNLGSWKRPMTEIFEECCDVRAVIRRPPEWLRGRPDFASFH